MTWGSPTSAASARRSRPPTWTGSPPSGRRFTNMHNNPRCCPSRATLLTGLYPTQAGVGFMTDNQGTPAYQGYLNRSCVTLAEALGPGRLPVRHLRQVARRARRRGSMTGRPTRGFERSYCQMGGGDYYRPTLYQDGTVIGTPTDPDYYLTTAHHDHRDRLDRDVRQRPTTRSSCTSATRTRTSRCRRPRPPSSRTAALRAWAGTSCATSAGAGPRTPRVVDPAWKLPPPARRHGPLGRRRPTRTGRQRGWRSTPPR